MTSIKVWVWKNTKPENAGLRYDDNTHPLYKGAVGFSSNSGSGAKYWSPVKVFTNDPAEGANIAYEDFKADTIVDVKPYTPLNWYPDYGVKTMTVGNDTTGFVLEISATDTTLVYRPKAGVMDSATCRLIPYTNLEWRDYEFSGTIVKPDSAVYDSIIVGVDVYSNNGNQYRFTFRNDTMWVSGGGISETAVNHLPGKFDHGDSLYFKIKVTTDDWTPDTVTFKDSTTKLIASVGINSSSYVEKYRNDNPGDFSTYHNKSGFPALFINLEGRESAAIEAIKFKDIRVQKVK
jgi:hypothetical protein